MIKYYCVINTFILCSLRWWSPGLACSPPLRFGLTECPLGFLLVRIVSSSLNSWFSANTLRRGGSVKRCARDILHFDVCTCARRIAGRCGLMSLVFLICIVDQIRIFLGFYLRHCLCPFTDYEKLTLSLCSSHVLVGCLVNCIVMNNPARGMGLLFCRRLKVFVIKHVKRIYKRNVRPSDLSL